jgi:hypothetical protein
MPEENPRLRNLATRKQLLIVESELNRRMLIEDGRAMAREFHLLGERATHWRGLITAGIATIAAFRSRTEPSPIGKRSWFGSILNTVRVGTSLWTALRNGKGRR